MRLRFCLPILIAVLPEGSAVEMDVDHRFASASMDLYETSIDLTGYAGDQVGSGGESGHRVSTIRAPLKVVIWNNTTAPREIHIRVDSYQRPKYWEANFSTSTGTAGVIPGGGRAELSDPNIVGIRPSFRYREPIGGQIANRDSHHKYHPVGGDGDHAPCDVITYDRISIVDSTAPAVVLDEVLLKTSFSGSIPYIPLPAGQNTLQGVDAEALPVIYLYVNPAQVGTRVGARSVREQKRMRACGGCEPGVDCEAGAQSAQTGSLDYSLSMGRDAFGEARAVRLRADLPFSALTDPDALEPDRFLETVADPASGKLRQIASSGEVALINIISPAKYEIDLFHLPDAGTPDGDGIYSAPAGAAHTTITVENPDAANSINELKFTRATGTHTEVAHYVYQPASGRWQLTKSGGDRVELLTTDTVTMPGIEIETREVTDSAGGVLSKIESHYQQFSFGRRMVKQRIDPDGRDRTTSYAYYTDPVGDGDNYGKLRYTLSPTGFWSHFDYDSLGRVTKKVSPRTDGTIAVTVYDPSHDPILDVTRTTYDDDPAAGEPNKTIVRTVLGEEVGRRYAVYGVGSEEELVAQAPGAAHDAPGNLRTVTHWHTAGLFKDEIRKVEHPDGTITVVSYSLDAGGTERTTTTDTGATTDGETVDDGVRTLTVENLQGHVISEVVSDIAGGTVRVISSRVATAVDGFGRPTAVTHLDGRTMSATYDCCGLASQTDRSGVVTEFEVSDLISVRTRLGVRTTTSELASARVGGGRVETLTRMAIDGAGAPIAGTETILSRTEYDAAGVLVSEYAPPVNTDADPAPGDLAARLHTAHNEVIDAAGHTVRTTTRPDGSTVITGSYQDGRLAKVSGTGTYGRRYLYGVASPAPGVSTRAFTQEVLLDAEGADTAEWVKTFTDIVGRVSHIVTSAGAVTEFEYDAAGRRVAETDPDGVTSMYGYDARGRLAVRAVDMDGDRQIDWDGTDRITTTTVTAADRNGRDVLRSVVEVWTSDGDATSRAELSRFETSADGLESWVMVDGQESHTQTAFAGSGDAIVTTTFPDLTKRETIYLGGRVATERDLDSTGAEVTSTGFTYDALGRIVESNHARNGASTFAHYIDDSLKSAATPDPDGAGPLSARVTRYRYDPLGRRNEVTLPDLETVSYGYTSQGGLGSVGGARQYAATYTYDHAGRLKTLTAGTGTTTWNYHPTSGFLVSKLFDGGVGSSFSQTAAGRPLTRTLARGLHRKYSYRADGLLEGIQYFADSAETAADPDTPDVSYAYDRPGNLREVKDASGTRTFTTTPSGQVELEAIAGGVLDGVTIDPSYDLLRRRESFTFGTRASSTTHSFRYDAAGRFGSIGAGPDPTSSPSATYAYHTNSNLISSTTSTDSGGAAKLTATRAFDNLGRLTSLVNTSTGGVAPLGSSFSIAHNLAGQRDRITLADGGYWEYAYDRFGQLTSAVKRLPGGAPISSQSYSFSYDGIGNRVSATQGDAASAAVTAYSANKLNEYDAVADSGKLWVTGSADPVANVTVDGSLAGRPGGGEYFEALTSGTRPAGKEALYAEIDISATQGMDTDLITRPAPLPPGSFTRSHDADGNLVSDAFYRYTWDGENRLVRVETRADLPAEFPRQRLEFAYDEGGRRIEKKVFAGIDSAWLPARHRVFVYDGTNLVGEYEAAGGAAVRTYLWGADLGGDLETVGGAGGLLHIEDHVGGGGYFAAYDSNGNVVALADDTSGDLAASYEYTPFGRTAAAVGSAAQLNPFRFSTRYHDAETGYYYYGYRYYDPGVGKWLSRDPLGESGGLNLTGFIGNDPVNAVDVLGLVEGRPDGPLEYKFAHDKVTGVLHTLVVDSEDEAFFVRGGRFRKATSIQIKGFTHLLERSAERPLSSVDWWKRGMVGTIQGIQSVTRAAVTGTWETVKFLGTEVYTFVIDREQFAQNWADRFGTAADLAGLAYLVVTDRCVREQFWDSLSDSLKATFTDPDQLGEFFAGLGTGFLAAGGSPALINSLRAFKGKVKGRNRGEQGTGAKRVAGSDRRNRANEREFLESRKFTSESEARKAFQVYEEAATADKGILIGHGDDPIDGAYNGWQAFRIVERQWTPRINMAWIDGAVDAGKPVRLTTPFSEVRRGSVTWDEIQRVISRGGTLIFSER